MVVFELRIGFGSCDVVSKMNTDFFPQEIMNILYVFQEGYGSQMEEGIHFGILQRS